MDWEVFQVKNKTISPFKLKGQYSREQIVRSFSFIIFQSLNFFLEYVDGEGDDEDDIVSKLYGNAQREILLER